MDVLVCLAEHPNELASRDQLLETVWRGHAAADELLTRAISQIRHVLQDGSGDPKYIETVPKRGYRLIGEIRPLDDPNLEKNVAPFELVTHHAGRKLGLIAIAVLVLLYIAFNTFVLDRAHEEVPMDPPAQVESQDVIDLREKSIAVLPFTNISDDPGNEYFADGLSEEILNLLTRIPGLKVIGRTSSFSFKGKNEDLRVIGEVLGVNALLEGSVRKSGDKVRIAVQLIDASNGTHIWSETYERTMTDIFAVQDDVAAAIIDALQIHVGTNLTRGRPTENAEAYALFLKAKALHHDGDQIDAEKLAVKAIELDPGFAEAYELLAIVYWAFAGDTLEAAEAQKLMGEAAAKALAIDPDLVFAKVMYQAGNLEAYTHLGEIEALERAVRDSHNPNAMDALVFDLMRAGYIREALGFAERYVEIEPLSSIANNRLFQTLFAAGRTEEAIAAMEVVAQLRPTSTSWRFGIIDQVEGRDESAIGHFETHLQRRGVSSNWVRDLVTGGRDSVSGAAYLDRRIPEIVAAMPEGAVEDIQFSLTQWYLHFGHLDRYFDEILDLYLTDSTWSDAEGYIYFGTIYRRVGFTGHPKYLEVAESLGIVDIWEHRGAPDFCEYVDGQWTCQ